MSRAPGHTKRGPRVAIRRPAVLIDSDGVEMTVLVLDVSNEGFRIQAPQSPRIGERVTLRIEGYDDFAAQIRWALGDEAGGVFLTRFEDPPIEG